LVVVGQEFIKEAFEQEILNYLMSEIIIV